MFIRLTRVPIDLVLCIFSPVISWSGVLLVLCLTVDYNKNTDKKEIIFMYNEIIKKYTGEVEVTGLFVKSITPENININARECKFYDKTIDKTLELGDMTWQNITNYKDYPIIKENCNVTVRGTAKKYRNCDKNTKIQATSFDLIDCEIIKIINA